MWSSRPASWPSGSASPNERQWTPVADLSGGERRRLQLLRLLLGQPNVLLLDEPTNDLDTDTLAELEDLLDSWAGTLVVVSHDRYLVERVCDSTVALLGDGSLAALPGGIEQYLQRRRAEPAGGRAAAGRLRQGCQPARKAILGRPARSWPGWSASWPSWSAGTGRCTTALAEHAADYVRVAELDAELRTVLARKEATEQSWLELAEQ